MLFILKLYCYHFNSRKTSICYLGLLGTVGEAKSELGGVTCTAMVLTDPRVTESG